MKSCFLFVVTILLLPNVFSQGENFCSSSSSSSSTLDNTFVGPSRLLYVIIDDSYYDDMYRGYTWVQAAVAKHAPVGSTTQLVWIRDSVVSYLTLDLSQFDQIWVVDLDAEANMEPHQLDAYAKIGNWFRARGQPNTILDARIISSFWYRTAKGDNTNKTNDILLVENYFVNLRIRGGGLFLGTDHNVFHSGIQTIADNIGITRFCCFYYEDPYRMIVDPDSPLMSYPNRPYYIAPEGSTLPKYWIWDDSSTGNVAINTQRNGQVYYPLGWHYQQGVGDPGLSSTIRGAVGFLVNIVNPICHERFNFSTPIDFRSVIARNAAGNPPYTYRWTSSINGQLSTVANFTTANLTRGTHVITLRVVDSSNLVAESTVSISIVKPLNDSEGPTAAWNGNKDVQIVYPIRRPMTPVEYYNYRSERANTPDALESTELRSGQFFFYDDGTDLWIFHLFGNPRDTASSAAAFNISFPLLAERAGSIVLRDPPTASTYAWNSATGTGSAKLQWTAGKTAGFIAGPLPRNFEFCINYVFDKTFESNMNMYMVRSHNDGSFSNPNPNPIISYRSKATETRSLDICWLQYRCGPSSRNTTDPANSITNSIVQFSYDGSLLNYTDTSRCAWLAQPVIPGSVVPIRAIWIAWRRFSQLVGDRVMIHNGTSASDPTIVDIDGSSYSSLPPNSIFMGAQALYVESVPNRDGQASVGFKFDYYVVPTAISLSPSTGPYQQATVVNVTGGNFYQRFVNGVAMNRLFCRLDGSLVVSARLISHDKVECTFPARPQGPKSNVPVEVSNDGVVWSNSLVWAWTDATCSQLTVCGACLANSSRNCQWCNEGSFCYAAGQSVTCSASAIDTTCCTRCQPLSGCGGVSQGSCNCNDTCSCTPQYRNADCGCKKCPVHPSTSSMCGSSANATVTSFGSCSCNGTCVCEFGFWGAACECKACPVSGGQVCGGKGTCGCDGKCVCDATHTGNACECAKSCVGDDAARNISCNGHGRCSCGQCVCDVNWRLLDDCSCREKAIIPCGNRGTVECDGSCSCFPGYSGPDCSITTNCTATNCSTCLEISNDCGWCESTQKCENKFLERRVCGQTRPRTGSNATLPYVSSCPAQTVTVVDDPVNFPVATVATAAVISAAVLLGAIIAVAAIMYRRRNTSIVEGSNPWLLDDMDGNETVDNPLYENLGTEGSNPLYQLPKDEATPNE
eukprot:TRINITY_DN2746_c0_g1_i1.p1 TRINITY_DN2746_c0_g1~~TRINITY_DN2746_c0_g1_i1.p1  ORF type:complete len:1194 (-),score=143.38 TRINITY_DN2746_c0_g1_i1:29-3610(-)